MSSFGNIPSGFNTSLTVVIAIFSIMFFLIFLLIVYAKFCYKPPTLSSNEDQTPRFGFAFDDDDSGRELRAATTSSRFSGIDKTVIDSLPFFRFSSLKGAREGLECAVCLSKFEDIEILRLIPKCKHAFHIGCVDRWLESHSSCPLCRQKVDPSDLTIFTYSDSFRLLFSRNPSAHLSTDEDDPPNFDLFVRREEDNGGDDNDSKLQHKFKHMIIVSDVVFKNRWSDVNSSDLMLLNSEMLRVMSSKRFDSSSSSALNSERFIPAPTTDNGSSSNSNDQTIMEIKEEMERKRVVENKIRTSYSSFSNSPNFPSSSANSDSGSRSEANPNKLPMPGPLLVASGARSVSETSFARFPDYVVKNRMRESLHRSGKEENRIRKVWIPIARRTVQWFAGREERSQHQQQQSHSPQSHYTSNV